jgi:endonuclease/exonuclease/phosphatase family metal-dependent hydrolase
VKLRVLSYNIHKCIGGVDRRYEPSRIIEVIRKLDADLVMLQEVDDGAKRTNHHRQVDVIGDELGLRYRTWFPNVGVRGGGHYGNAILSRFPLIESKNIDLTLRFKKARSVLHAVIRVRQRVADDEIDRTVHLFNMHLGLARYERKIQLRRFLESDPFTNLHADTPIVVGGDLNDVYGGLGELLVPSGFAGVERRPRTFPAWGPLRALDAIFVRGAVDFLDLARCDSDLARRASDHRPLLAQVRLHEPTHKRGDELKPPAPRP